jgi:hypothetical protein
MPRSGVAGSHGSSVFSFLRFLFITFFFSVQNVSHTYYYTILKAIKEFQFKTPNCPGSMTSQLDAKMITNHGRT